MSSNKLFVGGLAWGTDDETLRAAFEDFGEVLEVKVIFDRETGQSRGFGFVTFSDAADAAIAMREMEGAELDGRAIRVNEANERGGSRDDRARLPAAPRNSAGPKGGQRLVRRPSSSRRIVYDASDDSRG